MGLFDEMKDKAKEVLDKTDLDEKILEKAVELKDKAKEALEKTDIDDKIKAKAGELRDKAAEFLGGASEEVKEEEKDT